MDSGELDRWRPQQMVWSLIIIGTCHERTDSHGCILAACTADGCLRLGTAVGEPPGTSSAAVYFRKHGALPHVWLSLQQHIADGFRAPGTLSAGDLMVYTGNEPGGCKQKGTAMILPKNRDPRFITLRRGGTLTDSDHQLLALWAATCAEHVLPLFESAQPSDPRPRQAIAQARAWVRGEVNMSQSREAAGHANAAARPLTGAARHAAYAAAQAAAVAHVAAHELGAAAYAIKAARAAAPDGEGERAGRLECQWQRDQLPEAIRALVIDDERLRNDICWSVFDC